MHLRSGRLVHNLEVIATMNPNSSNVLRDIQELLQLIRNENEQHVQSNEQPSWEDGVHRNFASKTV